MKDKANFEILKNLDIDEMSDFLARLESNALDSWFDRKYCKKCEIIKDEDGIDITYCEKNEKCKFFPNDNIFDDKILAKIWLNLIPEDKE